MPEATVNIESLGLQKQTGPAGTAQFDNISAGTYKVEATAPDKQPMVLSVTIDAGALTAISFDLING